MWFTFALVYVLVWRAVSGSYDRLFENNIVADRTTDGIHYDQGRPKYPFLDPSLPWDVRVDDLVGRLTLDEIVNQTDVIYSTPTPAIPRLGIKPYPWITECLRGQVHTNTTAFPQALGLAASFSGPLVYNISKAVSYELRAHWNANVKRGIYKNKQGLSCFSPVINIMRHPLWGRNQETYGEDPHLSGVLAQHFVRGLQGDHPRYVRASAGCKHFDVHGGPEDIPTSRMSFDAKVSMRDWRMTFLPQFKMCVEAGTYNLMCSYNRINGVPSCANKKLLTDITRLEWGFKGHVISDAGAIGNIITRHKYLPNATVTAATCIKAGCNQELGGEIFLSQLDALKQGLLTEKEIRDNVRPMFYARMRLGEFDPEPLNPYNRIDMAVIQSTKHRELAVEAAVKSFVLLKNDGNLLPLKTKYRQIAIVGPFANIKDQLFGDYSSDILSQYTRTVYQGLARLAGEARLASGCEKPSCLDYNRQEVQTAVAGSQLAIVCLGLGQSLESEGRDRSTIALPGQQLQILKDTVQFASGSPVLLLLFNAGPLDIGWAKASPDVAAIVECFYPAQATGEALYRALTGAVVPGGRLPATWPTHTKQVPPITDYTMEGRTYRYYKAEPLYPFGYGLSYSRFVYKSMVVQPAVIQSGQDVQVSCSVINQGKYDADEVIQVYLSWPNTTIPVPKLQLVAFSREFILAGSSIQVDFTIRSQQMAVWLSDSQGWGIIPGTMTVYIGGQQPNQATRAPSNVLQTTFVVKG